MLRDGVFGLGRGEVPGAGRGDRDPACVGSWCLLCEVRLVRVLSVCLLVFCCLFGYLFPVFGLFICVYSIHTLLLSVHLSTPPLICSSARVFICFYSPLFTSRVLIYSVTLLVCLSILSIYLFPPSVPLTVYPSISSLCPSARLSIPSLCPSRLLPTKLQCFS